MQKIIVFFVCICFSVSVWAEPAKEKKKICLNMIVKDESRVIERCLGSLKHMIDYWVIVDTGSKDGTQEIIKNFLKDIPGELHERPWVNFAHNRNEALRLAKNKGDYLLLIDADEVLQFSPDFSLPPLDKDVHFILVRQLNSVDVKRNGLINNRLNWKWKGVLHEVLECPEAKTNEVLKGVINVCNSIEGSGRSQDPEKYLKDALALEKALKDEPNNSRYAYYLGVSYAACGEDELARKAFEKRVSMPSQDTHETFLAIYSLAKEHEVLNNFDAALTNYFRAYEFRPTRAEPLLRAAIIYRRMGNGLLGYLLTKYALNLPRPTEDLCYEYMTYDYALLVEFANCALLGGRFEEGLEACTKLLANPELPSEIRPQVVSNYELAKAKLQR